MKQQGFSPEHFEWGYNFTFKNFSDYELGA
jgi:hypothetical protein